MNVAAQHSDPDRLAAQQAAARRFGIAIVTTSLVVATVAFGVYVRSPGPLDSNTATGQAAALPANAPGAETDSGVLSVLNAFAQAFQNDDDGALHAIFPKITDREARALHGIRARLGTASLRVADTRARRLSPDELTENFVIVADQAAGQVRLPFAAVLHRQNNEWKIVELH